jgi:hypothetical protein
VEGTKDVDDRFLPKGAVADPYTIKRRPVSDRTREATRVDFFVRPTLKTQLRAIASYTFPKTNTQVIRHSLID